jgi:hypothetical protein
MSEVAIQDYYEDDKEGHIDTRNKNFECESPDKHLGCEMGIDVQGQLQIPSSLRLLSLRASQWKLIIRALFMTQIPEE